MGLGGIKNTKTRDAEEWGREMKCYASLKSSFEKKGVGGEEGGGFLGLTSDGMQESGCLEKGTEKGKLGVFVCADLGGGGGFGDPGR